MSSQQVSNDAEIDTIEQALAAIDASDLSTGKTDAAPLLPLLHALQSKLGFIPASAVPLIAKRLNLSRAEVHGIISFYPDFRSAPSGRYQVQICRAEACQAMGSRQLEDHAQATLGVRFDETTNDGLITLRSVYCLGNCACAPSVRIDDNVYARVSSEQFDRLVAALRTTGAAI